MSPEPRDVTLLDHSLEVVERFLSFDTTSTRSNLDLIAYANAQCQALGLTPEVFHNEDGTKANLLVTVPAADGSTEGGVMLLGHTDTVPADNQPWTNDPFTPIVADGRIYGRGASDMKSFCACAIAALPMFLAHPLSRPIHVALTFDEELGCQGADALAGVLASRETLPVFCVVGEPTSMSVIRAHKSAVLTTIRVHGTASHSSYTNHGCNAIEYGARIITFIRSLADEFRTSGERDESFTVPYTTMNVGVVHGGLVVNVVPAYCEIQWEMRTIRRAHVDVIRARVAEFVAGIETEMRGESQDAHIEISELAVPPLEAATGVEDLISALGAKVQETNVSYGTEAGIFSEIGIPTVVCGPGSIEQAHIADEFVEISQIEACVNSFSSLAEHLSWVAVR